jgi:dTDP-4-amino-4,6-dideoxygalactose transaminase
MLRFRRYQREIEVAMSRVLHGSSAVFGPEVEQFEAAFAAYCGTSHCIGVASGTDALKLSLEALGIGPGDEVLVPALTAPATAQAVFLVGARPVYVDVDPKRRTMDPDAAAAAVGPLTSAMIPVHLYGVPADMPALRELADRTGLLVVEDCAQSHGAHIAGRPVGTFGHMAAFSFYPTKNLGCIGDGGAILTNDPSAADRVRMLANYGWRSPARISELVAGPSRLDAVQAAILSELLPYLSSANAERQAIARQYLHGLDGVADLPSCIPGAVWHQFVIEIERRDDVRAQLDRLGVGTSIHYDPPLHHHPALKPDRKTDLPVTERLCTRILSVPIQPEVVTGRESQVIDAILQAMGR